MIHLHYQKDLAESGILSAIQKHKQRGQQIKQVVVNPANDPGVKEIDNVPVDVDDKALPVNHFWVVA